MYLTYDEYKDMGGKLEETAFLRNIHRVCGIIDNATFNRVKNMTIISQTVKFLCCDLVDFLSINSATEKTITSKSQTALSVSESENYAVKSKEEQAQDIDNMICDYLLSVTDDNGTPLLYRGCST